MSPVTVTQQNKSIVPYCPCARISVICHVVGAVVVGWFSVLWPVLQVTVDVRSGAHVTRDLKVILPGVYNYRNYAFA